MTRICQILFIAESTEIIFHLLLRKLRDEVLKNLNESGKRAENHGSATADKFPRMNTNGETRRGTTDCTDITDTWERSATHEIHGSPNQNDLRKKIRRLFACFVGKSNPLSGLLTRSCHGGQALAR
jgi:hypothetical protein